MMTTIDIGAIKLNNPEIEKKPLHEIKELATQLLNNFVTKRVHNKKSWTEIEQKLKSLKVVNEEAGDKVYKALTFLSEGVQVGDTKKARDEYLNNKYGV
jgi:hypothetical protein